MSDHIEHDVMIPRLPKRVQTIGGRAMKNWEKIILADTLIKICYVLIMGLICMVTMKLILLVAMIAAFVGG